MPSFYSLNLAGFAAVNAYLLHKQYRRAPKSADQQSPPPSDSRHAHDGPPDEAVPLIAPSKTPPSHSLIGTEAIKFIWDYFPAYGFAVAADWIQGPHIYAAYRYEKNLPERLVAVLYATGFIAGGVSALFAGRLADSHGRRAACLAYCAMYTVTCVSMLSDNIIVLFMGRLAGGTATTLLFSVFDAWMIAEFRKKSTTQGRSKGEGLTLGLALSYTTTLSSLVAVAMGVFGDFLVQQVGSRAGPFGAGILCCFCATAWISRRWDENYGKATIETPTPTPNLPTVLTNPKIFVLTLVTAAFESSMYLFVFFWSAALQSAHGSASAIPFGLVFACFMCAMMVGSSLLSLVRPLSHRTAIIILMAVLLTAGLGLCGAAAVHLEAPLFYAFILIEAAVGAYYPVIGLVKSEVVQDSVRGSVYSLMRLPLNAFVVVAHSLDEEGDGHRNRVFFLLSAMLALALVAVWTVFRP